MIRPSLAAILILAASSCPVKGDGAEAPPESFKADQRAHWAFRPRSRPEPPEVKESGWVRNPIDRFILAGLEAVELPPRRPRPTGSP